MDTRPCLVCHEQAELFCLRCQEPYCSVECQSFDWETHKTVCVTMPSLVTAANFGRAVPPDTILMDILTMNRLKQFGLRPDKKTGVVMPAKPFKQNNINLNYQLKRELNVETPSLMRVEVNSAGKRQVTLEEMKLPLKPQELNVPKSAEIKQKRIPEPTEIEKPQIPLEMKGASKESISSASSKLTKAWMQSLPIEGTGFVEVSVQFTPMKCSQTAWVMLEKDKVKRINLHHEINKYVSATPNLQREEIKVNQLYRVLFEDTYYRGVTLEPVTDGMILVRLIDYGNDLRVPIDSLKSAIPRMNSNALAFQIQFETPREVAIGEVLNIQMKSMADGDIMNVLLKEEVAFATKDDLETVPIPVGTKKKLYCLDYSNIKRGYITACVYDTKAIARIEVMGLNISEHCTRSKDTYNPQLNELCLALYEDGKWYRAMVEKIIDSNTFGIVFIDYGNMAIVKQSDIRKMTAHFMQPCLTNKCYIEGAPDEPTDEDVNKMVSFFTENQKFTIESATKRDDGYMINVAELQW